jgi:hypothetical protein
VTGETPPVGIVFVLFSGVIALIPISVIFRSRPRTPQAALLEFYRTLSRGESKRALALLTNADRDSSTRIQPKIAELGRPNGYPLPFSDPNAFAAYWNELLRTHPAPYCVVRMSNVQVQQIAPDVAVVDYKLTLTMNTSLYYLLILLGILLGVLLAFAIDAMTRKVVKADLRKVLVRVGDEWKLFNGEWQGYEEYDLRWLAAA